MLAKIVYCEADKATVAEIVKLSCLSKFGEYNTMPQPAKIVDEAEVLHYFSMYAPTFTEHRQVHDIDLGLTEYTNVTIYYFHGHAYAVDWYRRRYFRLGCNHHFRAPTEADFARGVDRPGNCYHVSVCRKCGYVHAIDSSG